MEQQPQEQQQQQSYYEKKISLGAKLTNMLHANDKFEKYFNSLDINNLQRSLARILNVKDCSSLHKLQEILNLLIREKAEESSNVDIEIFEIVKNVSEEYQREYIKIIANSSGLGVVYNENNPTFALKFQENILNVLNSRAFELNKYKREIVNIINEDFLNEDQKVSKLVGLLF